MPEMAVQKAVKALS